MISLKIQEAFKKFRAEHQATVRPRVSPVSKQTQRHLEKFANAVSSQQPGTFSKNVISGVE